MNTVVSYDVVKKRLEASFQTLDIASEVERHTGIRLSCPDSKKQYNGACPYPGCSADTNGFVVWPELTENGCHYHCRRCGKAGHILNLVIDIKNLKFAPACRELGIPNPYKEEGDETYTPFVKQGPKVEQWKLDELQYITSIYPVAKLAMQRDRAKAYLAERGIPLELAVEHGLGYFPAFSEISRMTPELKRFRRWCDRIVFPVFTPNGEVGYCGRSLFLWESGIDENEHKRRIDAYDLQMQESHGEEAIWYQMPRWKYTYQQGFFNLQAVKKTICPVFVEGPFDALACQAVGIQAVPIGTNRLPSPLHSGQVILALDNDEGGRAATKRFASILRSLGIGYRVCTPPTGAKDWSEAYRLFGAEGLVVLHETLQTLQFCMDCDLGSFSSKHPFQERDGHTYCKDCYPVTEPLAEGYELCGTCLDLDKETRAPHELDGLMYCSEHYPQAEPHIATAEPTVEETPAPKAYEPSSLPSLPRKICPCVTLGWNAKGGQTKQPCRSKVADNGFCEQHGLAHEFLELGAQLGYPEVKVPFESKWGTSHRTIYAGVARWEEHACTVHTDRPDVLKQSVAYLSRGVHA